MLVNSSNSVWAALCVRPIKWSATHEVRAEFRAPQREFLLQLHEISLSGKKARYANRWCICIFIHPPDKSWGIQAIKWSPGKRYYTWMVNELLNCHPRISHSESLAGSCRSASGDILRQMWVSGTHLFRMEGEFLSGELAHTLSLHVPGSRGYH